MTARLSRIASTSIDSTFTSNSSATVKRELLFAFGLQDRVHYGIDGSGAVPCAKVFCVNSS
jgi:hypothetical protein